jgi:predicted  nucleic acid-binding Zn-ribbon protein
VNKWLYAMEFIDNLNLEIEELKKPDKGYLEEIAKLEAELKNVQSLKRTLENENASLNQQLETSKKEIMQNPTYQQNQWLTKELQQANHKIAKLEASFQGVVAR